MVLMSSESVLQCGRGVGRVRLRVRVGPNRRVKVAYHFPDHSYEVTSLSMVGADSLRIPATAARRPDTACGSVDAAIRRFPPEPSRTIPNGRDSPINQLVRKVRKRFAADDTSPPCAPVLRRWRLRSV